MMSPALNSSPPVMLFVRRGNCQSIRAYIFFSSGYNIILRYQEIAIIQKYMIEQLRMLAQLAQQTERYDDMTKFTKDMMLKPGDVSQNDRKLFSTAYKCKISERRTAWRAISASLCKETVSTNKPIIMEYKEHLEKEIRTICNEVLEIIGPHLVLRSDKNIENKEREKQDIRNKLEFYKMKGDYYRYMCEISKDLELKNYKEQCEKGYKQAMKIIDMPTIKDSLKTDSLKLAIYLNYSVFLYEIMNLVGQAVEVCEKGFNEALEAVSDLEDSRFTDTVTIMQLMHDNISSWKAELEKQSK